MSVGEKFTLQLGEPYPLCLSVYLPGLAGAAGQAALYPYRIVADVVVDDADCGARLSH